MANIKRIKKRIKSIINTHKITSAMKLVAAAKLAKAQQSILSARPYTAELRRVAKIVIKKAEHVEHKLIADDGKTSNALILVISSNKGLCGSYNVQLERTVRALIRKHEQTAFKLYFIGRKVRDLVKKDLNVGKLYPFKKSDPSYAEIVAVGKELISLYLNKEFGKIYLVYNRFNSAISFTPTVTQLLPFDLTSATTDNESPDTEQFKFDEKESVIVDKIVHDTFFSILYTAVLDSSAAEHGIRMTSMDNAAKNCKEMRKKLTIKMNKMRQSSITTELIEVVSGAESLKG